ncbi:hypothetical protein HMPREF0277_0170 [Corynebacterium accolens ATCC 49726]|nr:hypothetical protein HMPREF0277_0170 [Corynebacterium accolens ATCC 49726]
MEAEPATGNNRNQGKCLGTKLGALHSLAEYAMPFKWPHCESSWWEPYLMG